MNLQSTQGFSQEADYVESESMKGWQRLHDSTVIGIESVRDELGEVWEDCRHDNWDGFGAKPIVNDTLQYAYRFLEALPLGCPAPSIGAEPDGAMTFEWHRDRRHTLSVSIDAEGNLYFAALLGPSKTNGSRIFFGEVPEIVLDLIRGVVAA